jgi:WD40 repeat protein
MRNLIWAIMWLPTFAFAVDSPFDGTWTVDLNAIQSSASKPMVIVLQNGSYQVTSPVRNINIKADGTDQPVPGARDYDTLAVKVMDGRTVETIGRKDGRVAESEKFIVSLDGKTITAEYIGYPVANKQPITKKTTYMRVSAGPSGSHAISGSWRIQKWEASQNAGTFTYKSTPNGLMYSDSIGSSFDVKFDGKEYPIKGSRPGFISVTKLNDRSMVQTIRRDGKVVRVYHMTVSADGKTASFTTENKEQGTTTTSTLIKQ